MFELLLTNGKSADYLTFLSNGPTVKRGASLAAKGNTIYHSGGTDINGINSNLIYSYDTVEDQWSFLTNIPRAVTNHCSVVFDDILYIFGGNGSNLVNGYNLVTNVWTTLANLPFSSDRFTLMKTATDILVFTNNNLLYRMSNKVTGAWVQQSSNWTTRRLMGTVIVGSNLYFFGGQVGNGQAMNDRYIVAALGGVWNQIIGAPTPTPRLKSKMVLINNDVYMFGGETLNGDVFNDIWKWQTTDNLWILQPNTIVQRRDLDGIVVNDKIYISGGITPNNQEAAGWMCIKV